MNPKILYSIYISLNIIIIIDIILILYEIIFNVSPNIAYNIHVFDLIVCTILLTEFSIKFYISKSKKIFIKNNWLDLIASIPFDLILPSIFSTIRFIRLIRLLKLLRVVVLFKKFLKDINKFLKRSHLDRILSGIMITVLIFTVLLYLFGPNFNLFDSLYFVVVTITTVGYGDITPITVTEKIISLILIIMGIFIFSTITGAISSYLTDNFLAKENNELESELNNIKSELEKSNNELRELKNEVAKFSELIKR
ncbi:pH-gated potassium channel KcsA [Methanobrevibacter oralis]|uniref:PH-gated potassium channel KcsA n=2 Tax=Methanobrevibacter oralis TaxID=66851 RepID=A0A165ZS26_METOA|nr:potassium channel family protein [Methanobrevibacter oralis]KZX11088.1 pH-gated potassium channel KcsA [Methanobrevibacter oralis]